MKLIKALEKEAREIKVKIDKLSEFIDDITYFQSYSDVQRALTATQANTMTSYLYILLERIHYLEKENETN
jgi:hypothetical protein